VSTWLGFIKRLSPPNLATKIKTSLNSDWRYHCTLNLAVAQALGTQAVPQCSTSGALSKTYIHVCATSGNPIPYLCPPLGKWRPSRMSSNVPLKAKKYLAYPSVERFGLFRELVMPFSRFPSLTPRCSSLFQPPKRWSTTGTNWLCLDTQFSLAVHLSQVVLENCLGT